MQLNRTPSSLTREDRNKLNENWGLLELEIAKIGPAAALSALAKVAADDANKKSAEAKSAVANTQQQIDELVVSGDSSPQATQASVGYDGADYGGNLKARLDAEAVAFAAQLEDIAVNVSEFGWSKDNTWQENREAVHQAQNYIVNKNINGGTVIFPSGDYIVKGIMQKSCIKLKGNETIFTHPDGKSIDIITTELYNSKANTTAGSKVIILQDVSKIKVGGMLAVRGGGKKSPRQNTKTTQAITAVDTVVTIENDLGFHVNGFGWLGNEFISWSRLGKTLTIQRGLFGTIPSPHSIGTIFYNSMMCYAEVTEVSGSQVTVDIPLTHSLNQTDVFVGVVKPEIEGINFDGKRSTGATSNSMPIRFPLVKDGIIKKCDMIRGHHGGLILTQGSRGCVVEDINVTDCGMPAESKGAGVWLFQGCSSNILSNVSVKGDCYYGIYLDDRTEIASEWDDESNFNTLYTPTINIKRNGGNSCLIITCGNYNKVYNSSLRGGYSGFVLASNQNTNVDNKEMPCEGNIIESCTIEDSQIPYSATVRGNTISNTKWLNTGIPPIDIGNKLINTGSDFGVVFYPSGYRWLGSNTEITEGSFTNDKMLLIPFSIPRPITLTEVGVEVSAVANLNSTARVGIYNSDIDGKPSTMNWDSLNAIPLNSIGVKYVTLDRHVPAGNYYLALSFRGAPDGLVPTLKSFKQSLERLPSPTRPTGVSAGSGYIVHGASSALSNPANQRGDITLIEKLPCVYIKVA